MSTMFKFLNSCILENIVIDELIVKQQTEKLMKSVENREWGKILESQLNEKKND